MDYNKLEKNPGVYQYDGQKLSYRLFPVTSKPGDGFKYNVSTPFVKGKNGTIWFGVALQSVWPMIGVFFCPV